MQQGKVFPGMGTGMKAGEMCIVAAPSRGMTAIPPRAMGKTKHISFLKIFSQSATGSYTKGKNR